METNMTPSRLVPLVFTCLGLVLVNASPLFPAEGMWTFDNLPLRQLKDRYDFTPTQDWLDHVRLSCVRLNDGGSGSFVSPTGLVLTNHHVALSQLQEISSPQKDYVKNGFYARSQVEELKLHDLEMNVLISMDDVTTRVQRALQHDMNEQKALAARKSEIAQIEKESLETTGLFSEVIALYNGGEYWLYRYKRYIDIRLVFAPESQIAFFGGDPDNFTYPRYDLDIALLRVYEDDRPIESKHYLTWSLKGAADGELVFVPGHPGFTSRLRTMAQLEFERRWDTIFIKSLNYRLEALKRYAALGPEQARQAAAPIYGIQNDLKFLIGEANGLMDKNLLAKKQKEETEFRELLRSKPEWERQFGDVWDAVALAKKRHLDLLTSLLFRSVQTSRSRLASRALTVVRYVAELKKPDRERLEGYHDSQLDSLKLRLFTSAPLYPQLEEALLTNWLEESLEELGPTDPFVKAALNGRRPAEVVRELIAGTKLFDPDLSIRRALTDGGEVAIAASTDPLIIWMRRLDPIMRGIRKQFEDEVESVESVANEKLGKARFVVYGKSAYPDATFSLRLSYGTVSGYPMNGTKAPSKTTFYGLYDRAFSFDMEPPFHLPERYITRKDKIDLSTPLNFVNTCDTIGGNSGSPIINRNAELVGMYFDLNIEGLVGSFVYNEETNRAVAVHSAGIIEALRKLYDAEALADELQHKTASGSQGIPK